MFKLFVANGTLDWFVGGCRGSGGVGGVGGVGGGGGGGGGVLTAAIINRCFSMWYRD